MLRGCSRNQNNAFGALFQGCGSAWRLDMSAFISISTSHAELAQILQTYLAVRIKQLGLSAACEHFHEIGRLQSGC